MNYVITHLHTTFGSVGDSIITNKRLISKLKKLNMKSVCLTDHGNLGNMYSFINDCNKEGIKPIIGCEVYITNNRLIKDRDCKTYHLILIAKNNIGLKNLLRIVSEASINGIYGKKPRTDMKMIQKYNKGLICTTACVGGYAPSLICDGKIKEAEKHILELKKIFGEDLYLEIQPGNFKKQYIVNQQLIMFHEKHNIKLLAANDVHYISKEEWLIHDVHVKSCNFDGKDNLNFNIKELRYPDKCYYVMTYTELLNSFNKNLYNRKIIKDAIANTNELASKCNLVFEENELNIPDYECPDGFNPKTYLEHLCFKKLDKIKGFISDYDKYLKRIRYEIDTIETLGFSSYFLIMRNVILVAKKKEIEVGPGRGSVNGSLVAYLIGITKIDPIKYDLLFERFLSVHRKDSFPDIDIDFQDREEMFNYVINEYGKYHCAAITTYGMRKTKSSIRAVGRVLRIPLADIDEICSYIKTDYYVDNNEDKKRDFTIAESLEIFPELEKFEKEYPELFEYSSQLEGLPANRSTHAAGTVISKDNLLLSVPLVKQSKENKHLYLTSLDLHSVESLKLIKYDFLKINTLKVVKQINDKTCDLFNVEFNKYNNPKVWELICSKNTTGLFQIGTPTYKSRVPRFAPKNIEELAQCLALFRTPCISSKLDKKFMDIREGKQEIELIHPIYDKVTKDTNGIIIYQEQIMECCFDMGLPLHEGYKLIKASAKKDLDEIENYRNKLWDLCEDKMDIEIFNKIFKIIHDSGKYTFNKSHAIAYATLVYETAYYKTYYLKDFLALSITQTIENNTDKKIELLNEYVRECKCLRINILPLDIEKSNWEFSVEDKNLRMGFCALKNFSYISYMEIIENIKHFDYELSYLENIYKNVKATKCNKAATVALIYSGALGDREQLYKEYFELRKEKPYDNLKYKFGKVAVNIDMDTKALEKAMYDTVFSFDNRDELQDIDLTDLEENQTYTTEGYIDNIKIVKDKNNNDMAFLNIQTANSTQSYVMFYYLYNKISKDLSVDKKVKFKALKQSSYKNHRLLDLSI